VLPIRKMTAIPLQQRQQQRLVLDPSVWKDEIHLVTMGSDCGLKRKYCIGIEPTKFGYYGIMACEYQNWWGMVAWPSNMVIYVTNEYSGLDNLYIAHIYVYVYIYTYV
jgi:hypothetical protein